MFLIIVFIFMFFCILFELSIVHGTDSYKEKEGGLKIPPNEGDIERQKNLVTLEEQIQRLNQDGITLNEGITIDDLYEYDGREAYEYTAYDFIFYAYGCEFYDDPPGRYPSNSVWTFEFDSIHSDVSYPKIVKRLAQLSNMENQITELNSSFEYESDTAWLSYKFNGISREYKGQINNFNIDQSMFKTLLRDFETGEKKFYYKEQSGRYSWFYLTNNSVKKINEYASSPLREINQIHAG